MRKLSLILLIMTFFLVGCGTKEAEKEGDKTREFTPIEAAFKTAGEIYFNSYMSAIPGQKEVAITLEMMENLDECENCETKIDVSKIKTCTPESFVLLKLDNENNILDYQFNIECE